MSDDDGEALGLFTAEDSGKKRHASIIQVSVMLDQKSCEMQLDTGATVSILPKTLYDEQFNQWPLRSTKVKLKAYIGVQIPLSLWRGLATSGIRSAEKGVAVDCS